MNKPLSQIFNETAEAARRAFPYALHNLVVILAPSSGQPVYISPDIAAQLSQEVEAIRETVEQATQYMHQRNAGGFAKGAHTIGTTEVKLIALNSKVAGIFSEKYTQEMRAILTLDHEIGHHVVSNGSSAVTHSRPLSESAADAFAMLRHIQRFGNSGDYAGDRSHGIASSIVLYADSDHYTSEAITKAVQTSQTRDITHMSLEDTARLAAEIAYETHQDDKTLEKIRTAYLPVYFACMKYAGSPQIIVEKFCAQEPDLLTLICNETLHAMQRHQDDPEILKTGKDVLNYKPIKEFMINQSKTDPYWKEQCAWLASLDAPPKKNLLRRIGF